MGPGIPTLSSYGNGSELHVAPTGIISTVSVLPPHATTATALTTASDRENMGNPGFEDWLRDKKQVTWVPQLLTHFPREHS